MDKIIVVCGPTSTGKTAQALFLAKKLNGELVSADSRQIYKGMDIGTGKDLEDKTIISTLKFPVKYNNKTYEMIPYNYHGVPLWMYDIVTPDEEFSVAHYQFLAQCVIDSIIKRGNIPIIVGGTGLYISSIIHPFETADIKPDNKLRKKLKNVNLTVLQELVKSKSQDIWDTLNISDRSNPYRLIRKLEIAESRKTNQVLGKKRDFITVGLSLSNIELYQRINLRVGKRIAQGLLDEIKQLNAKGYGWQLQSFQALGYKEWRPWFENLIVQSQINKDKIIEEWKGNEHAYSRRQMTWFKKVKNIIWFDVSKSDTQKNILDTVTAWYNKN